MRKKGSGRNMSCATGLFICISAPASSVTHVAHSPLGLQSIVEAGGWISSLNWISHVAQGVLVGPTPAREMRRVVPAALLAAD